MKYITATSGPKPSAVGRGIRGLAGMARSLAAPEGEVKWDGSGLQLSHGAARALVGRMSAPSRSKRRLTAART
jgi:hypothetical protein